MKKVDIIREIARRTKIPRYDCNRMFDAFQDIVTDALVNGERVSLYGFLTLTPRTYCEREGYNPATGKTEKFEAAKTVTCRISEPLRKILNTRNREI